MGCPQRVGGERCRSMCARVWVAALGSLNTHARPLPPPSHPPAHLTPHTHPPGVVVVYRVASKFQALGAQPRQQGGQQVAQPQRRGLGGAAPHLGPGSEGGGAQEGVCGGGVRARGGLGKARMRQARAHVQECAGGCTGQAGTAQGPPRLQVLRHVHPLVWDPHVPYHQVGSGVRVIEAGVAGRLHGGGAQGGVRRGVRGGQSGAGEWMASGWPRAQRQGAGRRADRRPAARSRSSPRSRRSAPLLAG